MVELGPHCRLYHVLLFPRRGLTEYKGEKGYNLERLVRDAQSLYDDAKDRTIILRPLKTFCLKILEAGH